MLLPTRLPSLVYFQTCLSSGNFIPWVGSVSLSETDDQAIIGKLWNPTSKANWPLENGEARKILCLIATTGTYCQTCPRGKDTDMSKKQRYRGTHSSPFFFSLSMFFLRAVILLSILRRSRPFSLICSLSSLNFRSLALHLDRRSGVVRALTSLAGKPGCS